jgi:hypothetical protein
MEVAELSLPCTHVNIYCFQTVYLENFKCYYQVKIVFFKISVKIFPALMKRIKNRFLRKKLGRKYVLFFPQTIHANAGMSP